MLDPFLGQPAAVTRKPAPHYQTALPTAQQGTAQAHLEIMKDIVTDLPTTEEKRAEGTLAKTTGQLAAAEGAALRAVRAIILKHDQLRAFGGLRRVNAPAGDLLQACQAHYPGSVVSRQP